MSVLPVNSPDTPRFCGVPTFMRLPQANDIDLAGCDVVESNPLYDGPGQITALMAATVPAERLALLASQRTRPPNARRTA